MPYAYDGTIGIDVNAVASTTPSYTAGQRTLQSDGTEWIFLAIATSTALRQYDCVTQVSSVITSAATSTLALRGMGMAICQQTITSNTSSIQYCWFLVSNPLGVTTYKVRVAASCAIDAKLASTAFGGTLDDTTAGTVLRVDGIVLTDSQPSGSSGSRSFRTSNFPLSWGAV